ncbi:15-hydroxyprostaglandin dehydrogenase (NAD(+)) [Gryllus bimaculatus]|nr:15-hydroxyprostaglandin dehydrogenase (NAD(+)) [Gryllus bimaculatus]
MDFLAQHGRPDPCAPDPDAFMEPQCKTAVVTGGATGIGLAACTQVKELHPLHNLACVVGAQLLAEGAAQVLIVDTRAKAARAAMARLNYRFGADRALFARADVADPAQLECAFNAAVDRFGRVDILVNNAAVFDDCHWESAVNTNVKVPSRHECGRHVATFL